jgi:hypothetical protein
MSPLFAAQSEKRRKVVGINFLHNFQVMKSSVSTYYIIDVMGLKYLLCLNFKKKKKLNSVALVRKRTIPT